MLWMLQDFQVHFLLQSKTSLHPIERTVALIKIFKCLSRSPELKFISKHHYLSAITNGIPFNRKMVKLTFWIGKNKMLFRHKLRYVVFNVLFTLWIHIWIRGNVFIVTGCFGIGWILQFFCWWYTTIIFRIWNIENNLRRYNQTSLSLNKLTIGIETAKNL